ncbi:MAG: hypothetical protein A2Z20_10865 [Bdellovibrionales bacterium RBG_16_40_8]|nr:MAG: hypothetical protein A2Z20_10865 [Bdellovibrionales bacterium RBG_16_40_8]
MSISIIIPTFNSAAYILPLWSSLSSSGLIDFCIEIIVVNDASTDETNEVLKKINNSKLSVYTLKKNHGRFQARLYGAQKAKGQWLLYLDSRITVERGFLLSVQQAIVRDLPTIGLVEIDITKNIFCLYWQRSHEKIFQRNFKIINEPMMLNKKNYEYFAKGTTIFLVKRDSFLSVCQKVSPEKQKADDTYLLKLFAESSGVLIDPRLIIHWEPRAKLLPFLYRLFERGPSFVQYHVLTRRAGHFFYSVVAGLIIICIEFVLLAKSFVAGLSFFLVLLCLFAASVFLFGKNWRESVRMMLLHVLVIFSFGLGILYGLIYNLSHGVHKHG